MKKSFSRLVLLVLGWGFAAALIAASGAARRTGPGVIPALVLVAAVVLTIASVRRGWLKATLDAVPLRGFLALNVLRVVGATFLVFAGQGRLPMVFAERAGWGDIATAVLAAGLLFWPSGSGFRRAVFAWNLFGAFDLFVAVGTAAALTLRNDSSMAEMVKLPLALIPLWGVPMYLAIHATVFRRLREEGRRTNDTTPDCGPGEAAASVRLR